MPSNPWPALSNRDFRLFWIAGMLSRTGSWVHNAAVPYALYQLTHEAVWVGAAGFAFLFPAMLTSIPGGYLADHYDRRRLLINMQLVMAAIGGALTLLWTSGHATPWSILALTALLNAFVGLAMPTMQTVSTEVLPERLVQNGIYTNVIAMQTARAIGPLIAGIVLANWGAGVAFGIDAASYVVGAILVFLMHAAKREKTFAALASASLKEVWQAPNVAMALTLTTLIAFLGLPIVQLATLLAEHSFHVSASGYGRLLGAYGAGALCGAVLLTLVAHRFDRSAVVSWGVVTFGASLIMLGSVHHYVLGLVGMAVAGACFSMTLGSLNAAIQAHSTATSRGRAVGMYLIGVNGGAALGALIGGWSAGFFAPSTAVATAGVLLLIVGLLSRRNTKQLDYIDLDEGLKTALV